ncbi:MAG: hypothetical protein N3I35_05965 [Clostridia bacterium]|nr:hypothetical protein [Clostridia bacterium]
MLIDTSVTVAYKCSSCGGYIFFDVSYFDLLSKKKYHAACCCNNSRIFIFKENFRDYKLQIDCIGCGNNHTYSIKRKDIIGKDISVFSCPVTGIQQCFIGNGDLVRNKVDSLEKEMDALIDKLGYDNYFKNTRVMYDSLNRIHDIAEQGSLVCECGNGDIELSLLSDRIYMRCRKCYATAEVRAASNEDLKELFAVRHIFLTGNENYKGSDSKSFLQKTDG